MTMAMTTFLSKRELLARHSGRNYCLIECATWSLDGMKLHLSRVNTCMPLESVERRVDGVSEDIF